MKSRDPLDYPTNQAANVRNSDVGSGNIPPMDRRRFLTNLAAFCAAGGVGAAFAQALFGALTRRDRVKAVLLAGEIDPARQALLTAAATPSPAVRKLAKLRPLRRPLRPLPFDANRTAGLSSADSHRVHYERHYIEYHRRWEENERALIKAAQAFVTSSQGAKVAGLQASSADVAETMLRHADGAREAACMVLLHDAVFETFRRLSECIVRPREKPSPGDLAAMRVAADMGSSPTSPILLLMPDGRFLAVGTATDWTAVPESSSAVGAFDMAHHAWGIDHPDATSALAAWHATFRILRYSPLFIVGSHLSNAPATADDESLEPSTAAALTAAADRAGAVFSTATLRHRPGDPPALLMHKLSRGSDIGRGRGLPFTA